MSGLEGKVALVTGGSGGIGSAVLRRFVQEGAAVVCADINEEGGEKIVAELKSAGGQAVFSRCDVTRLEEVTASIDGAVEKFGRIDILFNNAATSTGGYIADLDPDGWDHSLRVMLTAAMYGMKAAIPHMLEQGEGFDHLDFFHLRTRIKPRQFSLRHSQSGLDQPNAFRRARIRSQGHPCQCRLPRRR